MARFAKDQFLCRARTHIGFIEDSSVGNKNEGVLQQSGWGFLVMSFPWTLSIGRWDLDLMCQLDPTD